MIPYCFYEAAYFPKQTIAAYPLTIVSNSKIAFHNGRIFVTNSLLANLKIYIGINIVIPIVPKNAGATKQMKAISKGIAIKTISKPPSVKISTQLKHKNNAPKINKAEKHVVNTANQNKSCLVHEYDDSNKTLIRPIQPGITTYVPGQFRKSIQ